MFSRSVSFDNEKRHSSQSQLDELVVKFTSLLLGHFIEESALTGHGILILRNVLNFTARENLADGLVVLSDLLSENELFTWRSSNQVTIVDHYEAALVVFAIAAEELVLALSSQLFLNFGVAHLLDLFSIKNNFYYLHQIYSQK